MDNQKTFRAKYIDIPEGRPVTEVDAGTHQWVHITDPFGRSLWLDVRGIGRDDDQHLCIDVHAFRDGEPARVAPWGMEQGSRYELPETGHTTHGWNAVIMPILIMGEKA
jgi:hypothetical protein